MAAMIQWFANLQTTELIIIIGGGLILTAGLGGWLLVEEYKMRKVRKNHFDRKY